MCRWFAYISPTEPCLLEDVLLLPAHSLAKQVHERYLPQILPHDYTSEDEKDSRARNALFNIDGMGVAWYTSSNADFEHGNTGQSSDGTQKEGLRPAMYKTIQPPINDLNLRSICANTESLVCFGHIRAASGTAITLVNNHPFIFGRHTFMHNGAVSDFTAIRRAVCNEMSDAAFANIHGSTDSEHLAALFMTYLTDYGDASTFENEYPSAAMGEAMRRTVHTIIELQKEIVGDDHRSANSLNLCATDGKKLVACRFRNHKTSQPPSLYYSTKAGTTLNRKYRDSPEGKHVAGQTDVGKPDHEHGHHLIVASEPTTYKADDWELIGRNQVVVAEPGGDFTVRPVLYDSEDWDAKDHDAQIW